MSFVKRAPWRESGVKIHRWHWYFFFFSLNFIEFKFLKRTVIYMVYVLLYMSEMKIEKAAAVVDILLTVISPMHIFSVLYINYGGTHIHI